MSQRLRAWRRLDSRVLYQKRHVLVREDLLELPDGRAECYPVMALGGSAGVLPLLPGGEVLLVCQFRHVPDAFSWEIPGGAIAPGEAPDVAAQRELREEAGLRAGRLRFLGRLWPNNAYLDEVIHLFVGEELTPDPLPADADEHLERRAFPWAEALAMARDDRIGCGLTKLALLWAAADGLLDGRSR
ncbi:MAG: NUDIX hydrolase [Candidatus Methylomirabilales bacterium]